MNIDGIISPIKQLNVNSVCLKTKFGIIVESERTAEKIPAARMIRNKKSSSFRVDENLLKLVMFLITLRTDFGERDFIAEINLS